MTWHKWQFAVVSTAADDQTPWRHCPACGRVEVFRGAQWIPLTDLNRGCDDPAIVRECDGCEFGAIGKNCNTHTCHNAKAGNYGQAVNGFWWRSEFQPKGGTQ